MCAYILLRSLAILVGCLPHRMVIAIGKSLGTLARLVLPKRRRIVEENIARSSVGQNLAQHTLKQMVSGIFQGVGISVVETMLIAKYRQRWRQRVAVRQEDVQEVKTILQSRGVIILLAHYNCWEMAAIISQVLEKSILAVGQKIKNPYIDYWIKQSRRQLGLELEPKKGFLKKAKAHLEKKSPVAMLTDQNAGKHGQAMSFLGRVASTYTTAAWLALQTDSPIVPIYDLRDNRTYNHRIIKDVLIDPRDYAHMDGEEAVIEMTKKTIESLERQIEAAPEGWFWLHKRWKK